MTDPTTVHHHTPTHAHEDHSSTTPKHPAPWVAALSCTLHPSCGTHAWLAGTSADATTLLAPTIIRHLALTGRSVPADHTPDMLLDLLHTHPDPGFTVTLDTTTLLPDQLRDGSAVELVPLTDHTLVLNPATVREWLTISSSYYEPADLWLIDHLTDDQISAVLDEVMPWTAQSDAIQQTIDRLLHTHPAPAPR